MELKNNKGKLVFLTYNGTNEKKQTGIITAVTKDHILFKVNGEYEKPICKANIKEVEQLKTFSHYFRSIKRYLSQNKPDKALEIHDSIVDMFHEQKQINALESLKEISLEMFWRVYKLNDAIDEMQLKSKLDKIML